MNKSDSINELAAALAKAQAEMTFATKDSTNPHFKSKYADLSAVWDAVRQPLTKNGLSVSQLVSVSALDGKPVLVSMLMHTSGQWLSSSIPILNANNTSQGQGMAITYCRRYALAALVGCVQDDDDGEAAMPKEKVKESKPKKEEKVVPQSSPITPEQTKELHFVASQCDPDYLKKVFEWLSGKGINGFEAINTQQRFDSVIVGMRKNAQLYQKG